MCRPVRAADRDLATMSAMLSSEAAQPAQGQPSMAIQQRPVSASHPRDHAHTNL
jgi:hypothetical protein